MNRKVVSITDRVVRCPKCKSKDIVPISYGYPTDETMDKADRGEVVIGGCCIGPSSPRQSCRQCGARW